MTKVIHIYLILLLIILSPFHGVCAYMEQSKAVPEIKSINYDSIRHAVVITLTTESEYHYETIPDVNNASVPKSYYVDIYNASLNIDEKGSVELDNAPIQRFRWAENNPGIFRVVLDNISVKEFKTYTLQRPDRIVISFEGYAEKHIKKQEAVKLDKISNQANKPGSSEELNARIKSQDAHITVPNLKYKSSYDSTYKPGSNDFIENILGQGLALAYDGVKALGKYMLGNEEEGDYFINKAVSQMRDNNYLQQNFYMALFIIGQGIKTWDKHIDGSVYTISDEISAEAVKVGASGVIVTHNVFSDNLVPSDDDYYLHKLLNAELSKNDIEIYDFIMTNKWGFFSLRTASQSKLNDMMEFIIK